MSGIVDSDNSELICIVGLERRYRILSGRHAVDVSVLERRLEFVLNDVGLNGFRVARGPRQRY